MAVPLGTAQSDREECPHIARLAISDNCHCGIESLNLCATSRSSDQSRIKASNRPVLLVALYQSRVRRLIKKGTGIAGPAWVPPSRCLRRRYFKQEEARRTKNAAQVIRGGIHLFFGDQPTRAEPENQQQNEPHGKQSHMRRAFQKMCL